MITLQNEELTVVINPLGAELWEITGRDGTAFLWDGNPAYWPKRAPVLFPICGGLKEGKTRIHGQEYHLPLHGFAPSTLFSVTQTSDLSATFTAKETEETLKQYPYPFRLSITYTLKGNQLAVEARVENPGEESLYFSLGSHEAYACPEGLEAYELYWEQPQTLRTRVITDDGIQNHYEPLAEHTCTLPLENRYFEIDALLFDDLPTRRVTLQKRGGGRRITVEFPDCETVLIWTKPRANAPFVCIEPWCGTGRMADEDGNFLNKAGIRALEPGCSFTKHHTITLNA